MRPMLRQGEDTMDAATTIRMRFIAQGHRANDYIEIDQLLLFYIFGCCSLDQDANLSN